MTRSTFPSQIDTFEDIYDIPPSLVIKARRMQELKTKVSLGSIEQTELQNLVVELKPYMITPQTFNKFQDALSNMQHFIVDEVVGFIEEKQTYWETLINDFSHRNSYNVAVQYKKNNMITFNGDLYIALVDTIGVAPTVATNWRKIALKGDKGDVGLGLAYKGEYNSANAYAIGDAVTFENDIYYAKIVVPIGSTPSSDVHWQPLYKLFASAIEPATKQAGTVWIKVLG